MPQWFRKDEAVTKLLRENGLFADRDSCVTLPGKLDGKVHLKLFGEDMSRQRERVFRRDKGKCRKCGRAFVSQEGWEMHHVIPRGKGGSDDLSNLELRCGAFAGTCHSSEHMQVQWSKKKVSEMAGALNS